MTHGSLFTGIGGFDLASQWMGWENIFNCEIDEWCRKLLAKRFPTVIQHGDITKTDFTIYRGRIDVLTGGFPCQPHSTAGKQLGELDARDLWKECKRAISEIQPRYALFENVPGLLSTYGGRFFNRVLSDLVQIGYDSEWCCLPASMFGAPHIRERIWIISYPCGIISPFTILNTDSKKTTGRNKEKKVRSSNREKPQMGTPVYCRIRGDKEWLPEPGIPKLVNGLPGELDEIRGYGNSISPKVAFQIFKAIAQTELFSHPARG